LFLPFIGCPETDHAWPIPCSKKPADEFRLSSVEPACEYDAFWMAMETFKDRQELEEIYPGGPAHWEL
jgi:hypothetical protein